MVGWLDPKGEPTEIPLLPDKTTSTNATSAGTVFCANPTVTTPPAPSGVPGDADAGFDALLAELQPASAIKTLATSALLRISLPLRRTNMTRLLRRWCPLPPGITRPARSAFLARAGTCDASVGV